MTTQDKVESLSYSRARCSVFISNPCCGRVLSPAANNSCSLMNFDSLIIKRKKLTGDKKAMSDKSKFKIRVCALSRSIKIRNANSILSRMQISVWKRLHVYYMCCRLAGAEERFKNPIVGEERDHLICSQSPLWTAQRDLMCLHICWCGVYMLVGKRGGLLLNAIHSLTCLFVIVSLSLFLNSAAVDLISLQCHLGSL